jgi:hypothetical protein
MTGRSLGRHENKVQQVVEKIKLKLCLGRPEVTIIKMRQDSAQIGPEHKDEDEMR